MSERTLSGFFLAAALSFLPMSAFADTIVNLTLAGNLDIELSGTELSTIDDGNGATPGDQDTEIEFPENSFVFGEDGIGDLVGSFTLSGIELTGSPIVVAGSLLTYQTTGGTFEVYDDAGMPLLTGSLADGSFYGTIGTGSAATGGWLTVNLGTFTGPAPPNDALFKLLDPASAAMSISFTELFTGAEPGVSVIDGVLQDFTADATANIAAESINNTLTPEPNALMLGILAVLGVLNFRRRQR